MAAPAPADHDCVAADLELEARLDGGEIHRALFWPFDPEGFTNGRVIVGMVLDPLP
jgi:hypothetical protein